MSELQKYNKFIVALIGALVVILYRHFGANNAYVLDFVTLATAVGVYQVANK